ncbi:MAG: hypothetical protein RI922_1634 [Bacteroidota bacterium]|jgi:hypothetical protein
MDKAWIVHARAWGMHDLVKNQLCRKDMNSAGTPTGREPKYTSSVK